MSKEWKWFYRNEGKKGANGDRKPILKWKMWFLHNNGGCIKNRVWCWHGYKCDASTTLSAEKKPFQTKKIDRPVHTSFSYLTFSEQCTIFIYNNENTSIKKNSRPTVINDSIISKNLKNMIKKGDFIVYVNNKGPILVFLSTLAGY